MAEETLFPDSEVLLNKRPTIITVAQEVQFLQEIAAEIVKDGYSRSSILYIVEDLEKLNFRDSGFEMAKDLENANASYDIDSGFIEFLEDLPYRKGKLLEKNVKAWVKAFNPKPLFALGSKLIINKYLCHGFKTGQTVYVTGIYDDRAIYLVDEDPNRKGGVVLEYERVEESCTIQND